MAILGSSAADIAGVSRPRGWRSAIAAPSGGPRPAICAVSFGVKPLMRHSCLVFTMTGWKQATARASKMSAANHRWLFQTPPTVSRCEFENLSGRTGIGIDCTHPSLKTAKVKGKHQCTTLAAICPDRHNQIRLRVASSTYWRRPLEVDNTLGITGPLSRHTGVIECEDLLSPLH